MNQPTQQPTPQQALENLNNLRKSVLTVMTPNGASPLNGNDHDSLRYSIELVANALTERDALKAQVAELTKPVPPQPIHEPQS